MAIRIFHKDEPDVRMPMIAKDARLVVWLGVGSKTANMNYVNMQPGERNVPHAHEVSEDTIFILGGSGTAEDLTNNVTYEVRAGQVVHIPAGIVHALAADKGEHIESVGGPAPADESMLRKMGIEPNPPTGATESS
jgi:quercetin dioxygenase-like cupin family protein